MAIVAEQVSTAQIPAKDDENPNDRPTHTLTANQEAFCRKYVIMSDKVDAYQSVYAQSQTHRAHKMATSLLERPDVSAFVAKLRGKGPDLPSEEALILQKLLHDAKSGKLSHLERVRCMDLYIKSKRLLDLDDTGATDLPTSIDQAIKDIKAGSL